MSGVSLQLIELTVLICCIQLDILTIPLVNPLGWWSLNASSPSSLVLFFLPSPRNTHPLKPKRKSSCSRNFAKSSPALLTVAKCPALSTQGKLPAFTCIKRGRIFAEADVGMWGFGFVKIWNPQQKTDKQKLTGTNKKNTGEHKSPQ